MHQVPSNPEPIVDGLPSSESLEARACEFFRAWGVLDRLAHVEVVFNSRLQTTAGRARLRRLQIELNPHLLERFPKAIDRVLAHEAAHLATWLVHGEDVAQHGSEWRAMMRAIGQSADVTHDLPVDDLRRGAQLLPARLRGLRPSRDRDQGCPGGRSGGPLWLCAAREHLGVPGTA